jgi:cytochrome c-type biogenesis protein CcmH
MTRRLLILGFFLLAAMRLVPALAVEPDEMLKDPALEQRARAITRELRCLVCQGQDIDDSDAPLAADLRKLVRARLAAGDSDAQAIAFIADRYGDRVLMRPPVKAGTLALWLAPFVVLVLGLFAVLKAQRSSVRQGGGG